MCALLLKHKADVDAVDMQGACRAGERATTHLRVSGYTPLTLSLIAMSKESSVRADPDEEKANDAQGGSDPCSCLPSSVRACICCLEERKTTVTERDVDEESGYASVELGRSPPVSTQMLGSGSEDQLRVRCPRSIAVAQRLAFLRTQRVPPTEKPCTTAAHHGAAPALSCTPTHTTLRTPRRRAPRKSPNGESGRPWTTAT